MVNKLKQCLQIVFRYSAPSAVLYFCLSMLIALLPAAALIFTENLIDAIIGLQAVYDEILLWSTLLFLSLVLTALFAYVNGLQKIRIGKNLSVKFSDAYYSQLTALEYEHFENAASQDAILRLGKSPYEKLAGLYEIFCALVSALLALLAYIALFVQVSRWVLLILPVMAVGIYCIDSKNYRLMRDLQQRQSQDERFASYLESLCSNKHALFEFKIFGAACYILDLFTTKSKKLHREMHQKYVKLQRNLFFGTLVAILGIAAILFLLCDAVRHARISIGLFASLVGGAYALVAAMQSFSYLSSVCTQGAIVMHHYQNLAVCQKRAEKEIKIIGSLQTIEFRHVTFAYPNCVVPVLRDLSFMIGAEVATALVGKNGSGKSTIIKLLLRLYEPNGGAILINGQDIRGFRTESLHALFAVALQDFVPYSLTVRENLHLGNEEESDIYFKAAIDKYFPEQGLDLDTKLGKFGENGRDLSLGQWQRLLLCRLSLSTRKFLLLDEPTASLDPIAESEFYQSAQNTLDKRGSLIISHRLASTKCADTILVIDAGQLVQQGTHAALLSKPGLYRDMWERQSAWYRQEA